MACPHVGIAPGSVRQGDGTSSGTNFSIEGRPAGVKPGFRAEARGWDGRISHLHAEWQLPLAYRGRALDGFAGPLKAAGTHAQEPEPAIQGDALEALPGGVADGSGGGDGLVQGDVPGDGLEIVEAQ